MKNVADGSQSIFRKVPGNQPAHQRSAVCTVTFRERLAAKGAFDHFRHGGIILHPHSLFAVFLRIICPNGAEIEIFVKELAHGVGMIELAIEAPVLHDFLLVKKYEAVERRVEEKVQLH